MITGNKINKGLLTLVFAGLFMLAGCSMQTESSLTTERVNLKTEIYRGSVPTDDIDDKYLEGLSRGYWRYGDGGMEITVTYDPRSSLNTAMDATNNAASIAARLRELGVTDVSAGILPVKDQGDGSETLLRYKMITAHPPSGCGKMPGLEDSENLYRSDYKFGCSIETMLARQISRPKDLAGDVVMAPADGRREIAVIDGHRSGAIRGMISGETTTD
jgi:type IV pilus biogenesis protein CpaD/CtpE